MSMTFADLGVPKPLCSALAQRGVTEPFPIQAASIADALAGRDVSGKAPTGSGKTLAFGLPVLARVVHARSNKPAALILAPTRELADQITTELKPLAKSMKRTVAAVYGGVSYGPQRNALRKGVDVLVATPGRLEDLIQQRTLDLGDVGIVVIDEADRMADMGFLPAVRRILDQTNHQRQTLLFSATLDGDVGVVSRKYQRNPKVHQAASVDDETIDATHHFWLVKHEERVQHAADIIASSDKTIVFTRTRHGADRLAKQLGKHDVRAVAMHGGRSQGQRTKALKAFSNGSAHALIATDVAARGIHVDDVSVVVHFDPAAEPKDYVHRSGRTARAGASGTVVSLVKPDQRRSVLKMQRQLSMPTHIGQVELSKLDRGPSPTRPPKPSRPASPHDDVSTSIFVGNLPWSTTPDDLDRLFRNHGPVTNTAVATRRGKSKGYGFVEMPESAARVAIDALRGRKLSGRPIKVRPARP